MSTAAKVEVVGRSDSEVLTREALEFVALLHRELNPRAARAARRGAGSGRNASTPASAPTFLDATRTVREGDWSVAPAPPDLRDRRCEITGPADRKMMINALNSGARVFMADFEDACSPTWTNVVEGQRNLARRRATDDLARDGRRSPTA